MAVSAPIPPSGPTGRIPPRLSRKRIQWFPYIVLTPMVLWLIVFVFYPVVFSLWASATLWVASNPLISPFVGLKNYIDLFTTDRRFPTAFGNTLLYAGVVTPVCVVFGFLVANVLARVRFFNRAYIFAFFLPSLVPASVVAIFFGFFYQPIFGTANFLLKGIGLAPLNFLKDSNLALWTIATVEIWQRIGFVILVSYAGLVSMPGALIEAARIDGATGLQVLLRITLPLMRRVLVFVSVVTLIGALQSFDLIYVMTTSGGTGSSPGGPGISTYTLGLLVYNEGLIRGTYGTASATASILFVIVFFATLLQLRFFRQNWDY